MPCVRWFWSSWKFIQISPNKSSLAMRSIFGWMDMWTSKIVEFGTILIQARYTSSKSQESHCLVRILLWRNHRSVLLPKRSVAIIVNNEHYKSMISNFLWLKMDDMDTDNMWFQQDGATCHTACHDGLLHERFENMVTSLARRRRELATEIVRFNTFRLLPLGLS